MARCLPAGAGALARLLAPRGCRRMGPMRIASSYRKSCSLNDLRMSMIGTNVNGPKGARILGFFRVQAREAGCDSPHNLSTSQESAAESLHRDPPGPHRRCPRTKTQDRWHSVARAGILAA